MGAPWLVLLTSVLLLPIIFSGDCVSKDSRGECAWNGFPDCDVDGVYDKHKTFGDFGTNCTGLCEEYDELTHEKCPEKCKYPDGTNIDDVCFPKCNLQVSDPATHNCPIPPCMTKKDDSGIGGAYGPYCCANWNYELVSECLHKLCYRTCEVDEATTAISTTDPTTTTTSDHSMAMTTSTTRSTNVTHFIFTMPPDGTTPPPSRATTTRVRIKPTDDNSLPIEYIVIPIIVVLMVLVAIITLVGLYCGARKGHKAKHHHHKEGSGRSVTAKSIADTNQSAIDVNVSSYFA